MALVWTKREESPTFTRWTAPSGSDEPWEIQRRALYRTELPLRSHVVFILWPPQPMSVPSWWPTFGDAAADAEFLAELRS